MATQMTSSSVGGGTRAGYERFAGYCALVAGIGSLLYSVAFVILKQPVPYSALLMVGG